MCTITASEIQKDGAAVASAIEDIANYLKASNPTLAAQLTAAAMALENVTSNWSTGSNLALFNDAASAVEAVLALIPQTSAIVPFVEIAVTALDILIANIEGSPAAGKLGAPITVESVKQMQDAIAQFPPNPYRGRITIHRAHFQSPRDAFRVAWDAEVDKQPALGISKI